jgi:hypothetical protein
MNNVIHGKGMMTYPTGLVEEGDWIDGEIGTNPWSFLLRYSKV